MASTDSSRALVNPWWLSVPLNPLAGLADGDNEEQVQFAHLDPNNEIEMRTVIIRHIVPYVRRIDVESVSKMKRAYMYYLSSEYFPWGGEFDSCLLPFDHPDNARSFFLWIWEECFPGVEWRIDELHQFSVNSNIEEPYKSIKLAREV